MAFKFQWSGQIKAAANQATDQAAKDTFTLLNQQFQFAITAKKWSWPTAPTTRDIVDTGALRASNSLAVSGLNATFKWTVNYASFAHEGAIGGRKNYPARPWTDAVLNGEYGFKRFEAEKVYADLWVKYFKGKV